MLSWGPPAKGLGRKEEMPCHLPHPHYPTPVSFWLTLNFHWVFSWKVTESLRESQAIASISTSPHFQKDKQPEWEVPLFRAAQRVPIELTFAHCTTLPSPAAPAPPLCHPQLGTPHLVTRLSQGASSFCHGLTSYAVRSL